MKLLVIDGNSVIHRAYHGVRPLSNHEGIFTHAIFGFLNMYFKEIRLAKPDGIAVAFDMGLQTFRREKVESYKANRNGMPEALAMQMPYIKKILQYMGIACLGAEGFEADDILGTLADVCHQQNQTCILMTGDKDSLQLITEHVTVHLLTKKGTVIYTPEKFREDYGFEPESLVDLKALMGDASDNIPGVAQIGEKTANNLIRSYGSIENLYRNLEQHPETFQATPRVRKLLTDGKESAFQSRWLAQIVKNAPVCMDLQKYLPQKQDSENLRKILTELEMFKLLDKLHLHPLGSSGMPGQENSGDFQVPELKFAEKFDLDLLRQSGKPVSYVLSDGELIICTDDYHIMKTQNLSEILDFLESDPEKITDDAKAHYRFALEHHRELKHLIFDAVILGYLLNPSANDYQIPALCAQLGVPCFEKELENYASVQALPGLYEKGIARLKQENLFTLWTDIELPLTRVLASMEYVGILVDPDGIRTFGEDLKQKISDAENRIYQLAGEKFNIASPKQLGVILFEKLKLPVIKRTKTGYSTNAEILEELRPQHEIIDFILEYRQYTKLQSTYVDGLLKTIAPDGRIHTNYRQTETRTGRISSTEPNLQNIPVRTKLGRQMRKFFTAAEGNILLDADYSQIELRLMAHFSQDAAMQEAFASGFDVHTATAAKIFHVPELLVQPEMRSAAKAINFGILYGMGAFSLSKDIHVTREEAEQYIQDYLGSYPKVSGFLEKIVRDAEKSGYVCTMFQRKRYVPELRASNRQVQASGRRIAMNTPVQGTAADIIKLAMIRVHDRLARELPAARLLLQVHDELIIECSLQDADQAEKILHEEMTNAVQLSVPLVADVNRGQTWYDAKG